MNKEYSQYISGILYMGFFLLFLALFLYGSIDYYIAPNMQKFVLFAMLVFFLLGITQMWKSSAKKKSDCEKGCSHHRKNSSSFIFIFLVIIIGFILPDYIMTEKMAHLKGVQYTFSLSEQSLSHNQSAYDRHFDIVENNLKSVNNAWQVEDADFLEALGLIHYRIDQYIGEEMIWTGFVYRDPKLEESDFALSRFSFSCCVADSIGYGLIVESAVEKEIPSDWVRIKGVIQEKEINGEVIPTLKLLSYESIDAPPTAYVTPTIFSQ
ncbi:hypothetical protein BTS2_4088 [Bacillus sp. TS-2]|nr:hypothetical protein BTS2_4088 [Bacillus sp. TS-2]